MAIIHIKNLFLLNFKNYCYKKCIYNRFFVRSIQTTSGSLARRIEGDFHDSSSDPGIKRRSRIFNEDREFLSDIQDEEDFAQLDSDFADADLSYDQHKKLVYKKRQQMDKMMTIKKFFPAPKAPSMLTWAERLQIKQLHEKDPEEWSIDVLAESFPATKDVIRKVIDAQWMPQNAEKAQRMDEQVRKNWELLAQDRLEAEPHVLAHLKKFIQRREEYLSAMGTEDVEKLFEKEEPKKVWNKGQMTEILESYEKSLDIIDQKEKLRLQTSNLQSISEGANVNEIPIKQVKPANNREIINERIKFERDMNFAKSDSFKISGDSEKDKIPTTLDNFKKRIAMEEGRNNDPLANVMMENSTKPSSTKNDKPKRKAINERLANLAGYSLNRVDDTLNSSNKDEINILSERSDESCEKSEITVKSIAEFDPIEDNKTEIIVQSVKAQVTDGPVIHEKISPKSSFTSEEEREEFEKEETSIEGTFFWPNDHFKQHDDVSMSNSALASETVSENVLAPDPASSKEIGRTLEEYRKSSQVKNTSDSVLPTFGNYPQKIKIPTNKKGKGLTYKVNDCFYDENGEFLYRVPGMTTC